MKRFLSLMVALVLVLGLVGSASAVRDFSYVGGDKVHFHWWTTVPDVSDGDGWFLNRHSHNLTKRRRAVVRINTSWDAPASSVWVYDRPSGTVHPYKTAIQWGTPVQVKGRLDNRDSGTLNVSGRFFN